MRGRTLGVAALAAALAGCGGGGTTIDHTIVENGIATTIAQQKHVIAIVACPKGEKAKPGARFTCTATIRTGQQFPISVTVKDDKGAVHYTGLQGFRGGR